MGISVKRGLHRLLFLASLLWILYWSLAYPMRVIDEQRRAEAVIMSQEESNCPVGPEHSACEKAAFDNYYSRCRALSMKSVYHDEWRDIILFDFAGPILAYAAGRVLIFVTLWIWYGFKPRNPVSG